MTMIETYAPTKKSTKNKKTIFMARCKKKIEKVPRHDLIIMMGDFNAKVGHNHTTLGKHGM